MVTGFFFFCFRFEHFRLRSNSSQSKLHLSLQKYGLLFRKMNPFFPNSSILVSTIFFLNFFKFFVLPRAQLTTFQRPTHSSYFWLKRYYFLSNPECHHLTVESLWGEPSRFRCQAFPSDKERVQVLHHQASTPQKPYPSCLRLLIHLRMAQVMLKQRKR